MDNIEIFTLPELSNVLRFPRRMQISMIEMANLEFQKIQNCLCFNSTH
jgi:hypothetical protein